MENKEWKEFPDNVVCFGNKEYAPGTAEHLARLLIVQSMENAMATLRTWVHPARKIEVTPETIKELNDIPDKFIVAVLMK